MGKLTLEGALDFAAKEAAKKINKAMEAPLTNGLMDKETHAVFKKDMGKYHDLLMSGRTVEAASFLESLKTKYDK